MNLPVGVVGADKLRLLLFIKSLEFNGDDICILDDSGSNWWFGQTGETECWTNWFISEREWLRNNKLNELGI